MLETIATAYVVNWEPTSVGGFEWFVSWKEAEEFRRALRDGTARVHVVAIPSDLSNAEVAAIDDWLNDNGWSDGIDPR